MLELFMLAVSFAGGYAASVYTWPTIRIWINGVSAEAAHLRATAQQLETKLRRR